MSVEKLETTSLTVGEARQQPLARNIMRAPRRWATTLIIAIVFTLLLVSGGILLLVQLLRDFTVATLLVVLLLSMLIVCLIVTDIVCLLFYWNSVRRRNRAIREDIEKHFGIRVPINAVEENFPRDYEVKGQAFFSRVKLSSDGYVLELVEQGQYWDGTVGEIIDTMLWLKLTL